MEKIINKIRERIVTIQVEKESYSPTSYEPLRMPVGHGNCQVAITNLEWVLQLLEDFDRESKVQNLTPSPVEGEVYQINRQSIGGESVTTVYKNGELLTQKREPLTSLDVRCKAVEGEKEERIELLEIELSNTKILLEACESASTERDTRIKALEQSEDELCRKIEKEQAETIKIYNHYEAKVKALEERLEAADDVINRYTKDHGDIEGVYRKAALEKYNKLKH